MMLIPPFEQILDGYTLSAPASGFQANFVHVVVPTSGTASVRADGGTVGADQFVAIGSSGFSGAQVPVELGSHTFTATQPFGAFAYGFDVDDSCGYPCRMSLGKVATVETLTVTPASTTARPGT